jgi:Na+-driven multidrug efflux pump
MAGRLRAYRTARTSDNILKHGAIFFFFFGATTIINIAFRKYASVSLTIEDYGIFTALSAFYLILAQPFEALQLCITKHMSYHIGKKNSVGAFCYFASIFKVALVLLVLGSMLVFLFSPFLQEQYQLPSQFSVLIVIGMFFLASAANCFTAVLQAHQCFAAIGIINVITACIKIVSCYILLHLFFGDIFPAPVAVTQSLTSITRISAGIFNKFDIPLLAALFSMIVFALMCIFVFRNLRNKAGAEGAAAAAAGGEDYRLKALL